MKHRWVHYHKLGTDTKYLPDNAQTTLCGRTTKSKSYNGLPITNQLSQITCPRCIEILKKSHWYCSNCGFIDSHHVTNDEHCEICSNPV